MNSRLLAGMIAVMTLSGISSQVGTASNKKVADNRDARIIVEVNKDIKNLSREEIFESQNDVLKLISNKVTSNFELVNRYSVLNNAFVISVNSSDIEAIRALDEVASVTVDKMHAKQDISDGSYYSAQFVRPQAVDGEDEGTMVENISATTMNKPANTNDGEGTVIAILDNEFYLRGQHDPFDEVKDGITNHDDGTAWNHAVFKPLPAGTAEKFTYENLTSVVKSLPHAKRLTKKVNGEVKEAEAGYEGSLYFNNKVPFYYDYGGESTDYGKVGPEDYDVSSNLTYHGSHVSSIAAANADTYKGIAPKAQLACMKVFTTYEASKTGEQMGFGTSTGAYDSAILSALEDAIELGVDGINMSLGSDLNDFETESITMQTLKSLASDSNIMSAISAGNAGKSSYSFTGGYGNWTTDMVETGVLGSYANSSENMIIASGQPSEIYYENGIKLVDADHQGIKNVAYEDQIVNREGMAPDFADNKQKWMWDLVKNLPESEQSTHEIPWQYIPGFGESKDYEGLEVTGKVVCVNRGSTSFADKYAVAVSNRAAALIIINNDPTATDFNFRCSFGDDFSPSIPCALALYKDKPTFEANNHGNFVFIKKEVSHNDLEKTISSYSSDGARFDYSLKPDITTPGENIRGAVPPQKLEHRLETPLSTYEYLSGTSMAAPNYAGAQSLMLSKIAKGIYADGSADDSELKQIKDYRRVVDLKLMSTANPMLDASANPEDMDKGLQGVGGDGILYTSPRMQGAGMVDLGKAWNTEVYLDGLDEDGERIYKSKIQLKNNDDIAKGNIKLSFKAINESGSAQNYTAKVTVMRPAIASNNKVVGSEYNYRGEIDDVSKIPGLTYVDEFYGQGVFLNTVSSSGWKQNDVIKVTKQIEYYDALQTGKEAIAEYDTSALKVFTAQYYYNKATKGCEWAPLPDYDYQSIQDVVIDTFTQEVTLPKGENTITLNPHSLSSAVKTDILSKYPYGCAIEGYVELQQESETKLSIPYLGFYSGADVDANNTLENAPVVEPFSFEKDPSVIYPSDLVNDVTKQLVGKDAVSFGSSWTVGYAETTMDVFTDEVLTNDSRFEALEGFHEVGKDPTTKAYYENPSEHIYVGNPEKTNTMIINQFVMRSVQDNFFEIKNDKGETVYKSVLEDMLFGGKQLYKSHVEANYLSAGYVAHRAYAIIPLYDIDTGKAFADGNYTITFNYQLSYNGAWVNKSYNFIVDATPPEIVDIKEYKESGVDRVRIEVKDNLISCGTLGTDYAEVKYDSTKDVYYIDETKELINDIMDGVVENSTGQKRLFVSFTDSAYGTITAIIHFFGNTYSNYVIAQGSSLTVNMDFVKDGTNVRFLSVDSKGNETDVNLTSYVWIKTSFGEEFPVPVEPVQPVEPSKEGGCGGSIIAGTTIASCAALAGAALISSKKRKEEKEDK